MGHLQRFVNLNAIMGHLQRFVNLILHSKPYISTHLIMIFVSKSKCPLSVNFIVEVCIF